MKNEMGERRPVRLSKDRASTWKCLENEVIHVSLPRIGIIEANLLGAYALKMAWIFRMSTCSSIAYLIKGQVVGKVV